jgi:hypothetical protein
MKKIYLLLTSLLLIFGCSSPYPIDQINIDTLILKNGIYHISNKKYSGDVYVNNENDTTIEEGFIGNGKKEGVWKQYNNNGEFSGYCYYQNNKKIGDLNKEKKYYSHTSWYENGNKKRYGVFKIDRTGILLEDVVWTFWDEEGFEWEGLLSPGNVINYDWCYPDCTEPTGSFKFLRDGTWSSSTIFFGGMSRWGTWKKTKENDTIIITTTRISTNDDNDKIPGPQIIHLLSDYQIQIGTEVSGTVYNRNSR